MRHENLEDALVVVLGIATIVFIIAVLTNAILPC